MGHIRTHLEALPNQLPLPSIPQGSAPEELIFPLGAVFFPPWGEDGVSVRERSCQDFLAVRGASGELL